MTKMIYYVLMFVSLVGCGSDEVCADLQKQICKSCDVGDSTRDTLCACLEDGEVRNGSDYFETPKEAEVYCYDIKNNHKDEYVGPDRLAECTGELEVFEKYESDTCELYGYENASSAADGWGGGSCSQLVDAYCSCYGSDSGQCQEIEQLVSSEAISGSVCDEYLEYFECY